MWGTASAKTATFSVGFKPPVSGTYVVQATNASGASATSGLITVAAPEVGTDVSKQVTLAGMTTGTWATDNTSGISVQLFLMHPSQSANVFATNGNVCEMFDALFVEGGSAPAFVLPDFNNDIVSCKRYYEKSYDYATALGTSSANGVENMFLATTSATVLNGALTPRFKVSKRAAPTVVVYSETGAVNKIRDRQNNVDLTPGGPDLIGENGFRVYGTITAGTILVLSCHWTANARL
jgi:hypothetical protein